MTASLNVPSLVILAFCSFVPSMTAQTIGTWDTKSWEIGFPYYNSPGEYTTTPIVSNGSTPVSLTRSFNYAEGFTAVEVNKAAFFPGINTGESYSFRFDSIGGDPDTFSTTIRYEFSEAIDFFDPTYVSGGEYWEHSDYGMYVHFQQESNPSFAAPTTFTFRAEGGGVFTGLYGTRGIDNFSITGYGTDTLTASWVGGASPSDSAVTFEWIGLSGPVNAVAFDYDRSLLYAASEGGAMTRNDNIWIALNPYGLAAVPEPTNVMLFGSFAAMLATRRRRSEAV